MTYQAYDGLRFESENEIVLLCDHARNFVPQAVANGDLGLPAEDMNRHIAYDVGAEGVTRYLSEILDAPAIFSNFSRLVIDPNRGLDDPTLLMRLYDGSIIPANRHADEAEKQRRIDLCYRPYHEAVADLVARRSNPVLISVHSFTPRLKSGAPRPWHIGILSADDRRLSDVILSHLGDLPDLCVGDNEPYTGHLVGDTIHIHAGQYGHHNSLIEIRNDLIETDEGQREWAQRLAPVIERSVQEVKENGNG